MKKPIVLLITAAFLLIAAASALAAESVAPVIAGAGFEEGTAGWTVAAHNGIQIQFSEDTTNPHSGKKCLLISCQTPVAGGVYAQMYQNVAVLPETEYELSAWVRGTDVSGEGGASHFTDWAQYSLNLPTGTFGWQKVSSRFKTAKDQRAIRLNIVLHNKSKELAIDDVYLRPVGTVLKAEGIDASFLATPRVIGHDASGGLLVYVKDEQKKASSVEAVITAAGKKVFSQKSALKDAETIFDWNWNCGRAAYGQMDCTVKLFDVNGKEIASATQPIEKVNSPISADIEKVEERMKEFNRLYNQCKSKGIRLDYPTAAKTMIEQFIPLAKEDVRKQHDWRAKGAVVDFNRAIDESMALMQASLVNPDIAPVVKRYQTGKVNVDGVSFVGKRMDSTGKKDQGPLFFNGYGHFGGIQRDMNRWPPYGVNIVQTGIMGPAQVLTGESEITMDWINAILKLLDDAAKHNVKVDILLSPHYFPGWAYEKWPHLGKGGGGFYGFCMDAPEAKQVFEKFLKIVVPLFKDKPALHSFCLSNEPSFERASGCDGTKQDWENYLAKVHGDISAMNKNCGTDYSSFAAVPMVGWQAYDDPMYYDWITYLEERFAGWHKWFGDKTKELAPNIPVHSKFRAHEIWHRPSLDWGIDPELFGEYMDLNGNDCIFTGWLGKGWFGHWRHQNMAYDLQRSFAKKPIFNSENHPTLDRSNTYLPPEHFKTCLWQGAVHGQGATTLWVWERTDDVMYDFYGNVMDRPGCALAVGTTCLDLNRFAEEVTALQNAKAPVALLYSLTSEMRDAKYMDVLTHCYVALNFCGIKIDFISEKHLQAGKGKEYKMVILPQSTHILPKTLEAIKSLPQSTRLVIAGDAPTKNQYKKDYSAEDVKQVKDKALALADGDSQVVLWPALRDELAKLNALPDVSVVNASTGEPAWGVEWLPVKMGEREIINIVNLTDKPLRVKVTKQGRDVQAVDLLSLGSREKVGKLNPFSPKLTEIK